MNQLEMIEKYNQEKGMYDKWGLFIKKVIEDELKKNGFDINTYIRIPVRPRVKEVDSFVEKAFYRSKNYQDPFNDITDKVGVRFVVLLESEIEYICNIIKGTDYWDASHDRDYQKEKEEKPELFDYQSMHFILTAKESIQFEDVNINKGTKCEVQIRTLLQHAYAEMAHDQIYKSKEKISPQIKRMVARSMALIEATDKNFGDASKLIAEGSQKYNLLIESLTRLYIKTIDTPDINKKVNIHFLETIDELSDSLDINSLEKFLLKNTYIVDDIKNNFESNLIYRQPVSILAYYLLENRKCTFLSKWDDIPEYIKNIGTVLGIGKDMQ